MVRSNIRMSLLKMCSTTIRRHAPCKVRLSKKGKTSSASFERTFKDIKYFTRVYLLEDYFIQHKTLTITIPKKLAGYRLKEMNFEGYNIQVAHESNAYG